MSPHRIVVIGRGGREHALAWRLARDPGVERVQLLPGNGGAATTFGILAGDEDDPAGVVEACRGAGATLVVVGPESSLAAGVVDALTAAGIPAYGPTAAAARLESSKWFAKELMREAQVPTARAAHFTDAAAALRALAGFGPPWVIKADGLAAGKGVLVSDQRAAAEAFLRACLEAGRFGAGGRRIVIEEHLSGEEASVMAVCDGVRHVLLPAARDHKRARDGDRGPNTGGMGAFAPAPRVTPALARELDRTVFEPVLARMAARGTPFRGTLYAGFMLTADGPRVLEFNARFGDPETQVVLPLVGGSFARLLAGAAAGALDPAAIHPVPGAAVGIALVDEGYPDALTGTGVIQGLDRLEGRAGTWVFHAGTAPTEDGWRVRGGRAAYVVARDETLAAARAAAYQAVDALGGHGWRCRRDIAAEPVAAAAGEGSAG